MGRQAVVWCSGRPPCSASGLRSSSPRQVPGVPASRGRWDGAQHGQVSLSPRPKGKVSSRRQRGLYPQPRALGEHGGCTPLQHTRCTVRWAEGSHPSFTLLRRKQVFLPGLGDPLPIMRPTQRQVQRLSTPSPACLALEFAFQPGAVSAG